MANEKTWKFDMNRAYAATSILDMTRYHTWYIKAFLTGQIGGATLGLWTIVGSSDAVTGGMDGVDRWGATYTAAKLVRGNAGIAHSWCVLRSPQILSKYYYILLDFSTSQDYYMTWGMGVDAAPTGGTYQTAPTIVNGTTIANQSFAVSANYGAMKVHGSLATDGSFVFLGSRDNTGQFFSMFVFQSLMNPKASDQFPVLAYQNSDPALTHGVGWVGSPASGFDNSAQGLARAPDNSRDIVAIAGVLPTVTYLPSGPDSYDGSYIDWPIWMASKDSATRCIKGRLADIMYFNGGATTGAVDNPTGAPSYMVVNYYWFPTNAAPQL